MPLAHLLTRQATVQPESTAILHGSERWASYGEWAARSAGLAQRMVAAGLQPGDRVLVFMRNHPRYLEILWAAWWAGLAVVPVNAKLHPREVEWIIANAGARWGFVSPIVAPTPLAGLERQVDVETEAADTLFAPADNWRTVPVAERGPNDLT